MEPVQLLSVLWLLACTVVHVKTAEKTCSKPVDVAVLLDASGSIGKKKWPKVVGFTKALVDAFKVSEEGTHVGIVMYATKVKVQVSFNTFTGADRTPENINAVMANVKYNNWKGKTYIDRGLDIANRELFTEETGMRKDVKKVLILFTDGKQTKDQDPYTELSIAAQPIKDKDVEIHAIGIGKREKIDVPELQTMTTKPEYVYTAESFDELLPMALRIMQSSCDIEVPMTSVSTLQIQLIEDKLPSSKDKSQIIEAETEMLDGKIVTDTCTCLFVYLFSFFNRSQSHLVYSMVYLLKMAIFCSMRCIQLIQKGCNVNNNTSAF